MVDVESVDDVVVLVVVLLVVTELLVVVLVVVVLLVVVLVVIVVKVIDVEEMRSGVLEPLDVLDMLTLDSTGEFATTTHVWFNSVASSSNSNSLHALYACASDSFEVK